eukprot:3060376-Prymnesium_polylepis.6
MVAPPPVVVGAPVSACVAAVPAGAAAVPTGGGGVAGTGAEGGAWFTVIPDTEPGDCATGAICVDTTWVPADPGGGPAALGSGARTGVLKPAPTPTPTACICSASSSSTSAQTVGSSYAKSGAVDRSNRARAWLSALAARTGRSTPPAGFGCGGCDGIRDGPWQRALVASGAPAWAFVLGAGAGARALSAPLWGTASAFAATATT